MPKKADDALTRVEKHLIRPSSPWFSMIGDFSATKPKIFTITATTLSAAGSSKMAVGLIIRNLTTF